MAEKYTELKNPGRVRLWNKETGKPIDVYPVDANEILETSDLYSKKKPKAVQDEAEDQEIIIEEETDEEDEEDSDLEDGEEDEVIDLDSMDKAELLEFAAANSIKVSKNSTEKKIREAIQKKLS